MLKYTCGLLCSVCINFINAVMCICVLYDLLLSGAWLCTQFCQSVYVINFCKQGIPKTTLWLFVKCIADTPTTLEINFRCRAVRAHSIWLFNHFSLITLLTASLFSLWLLFNMLQVSSERRTQTATALLTMTADKHFSVCSSSYNKCLANAKRPCGCSVLCLRTKSSLCSCPHGPHYGRIVFFTGEFYRLTEQLLHVDAITGQVTLSQYFRWKEILIVVCFSVISFWLTALQLCRWTFSQNETL